MNNLSWIKGLYQHEPPLPRPWVRKLASLIPLAFGLYYFFVTGSWIPLVVSLGLAVLFASDSLSRPLVSVLGSGIFFVLHSLTLLSLILIYFFLMTPMALFKRTFQKNDHFFMAPGESTIRILDPNREPQFERQF